MATSQQQSTQPQRHLPTFREHVRELQMRFFWVAISFIVISAAAYPFFETIINFLLAPLSKDQELVYLTPGGAFSFIIKVCLYVGIVGVLPILIYNVYRFIMPAVKPVHSRRAVLYTISSFVLALVGISFAYYISLPASLYFLTGFNLYHINPMLTIDSYFSFVMMHMLAGALLFQVPVIMAIINNIKPLTPGKLMKAQRYIVVGAFIVAAVISPTPDALNQTLLALPIILMYQLGVIVVFVKNRRQRRAARRTLPNVELLPPPPEDILTPFIASVAPVASSSPRVPAGALAMHRQVQQASRPAGAYRQALGATGRQHLGLEGFVRSTRTVNTASVAAQRPQNPHYSQQQQSMQQLPHPQGPRATTDIRSSVRQPLTHPHAAVPRATVDGFRPTAMRTPMGTVQSTESPLTHRLERISVGTTPLGGTQPQVSPAPTVRTIDGMRAL